METLLKPPKAVLEAREAQRGLHWALEILIFAVLFIVCTFGEALLALPVQMLVLLRDADYRNAVAAGDVDAIADVSVSVASSDFFTILSLFLTIVMILIVFLFCRFIQKRKLNTLGFVRKGAGKEYLKGIGIGFLMFSAAVCICVLTGSLKLSVAKDTFAVSTFLLFALGYMVQGMAEEVLCRGYFMVSLGRRYPMSAAVLFNAAAFAALHLLNPGIAPLAIVNLILFGIFASVCFIITENIWLIGALHSVWNLVQGNIYGIKVSGMESSCTLFSSAMTEGREIFNGGEFGLEGGLAVTIVLLAGIAILFLYKNKKDMAVEKL